MSIYKLHLGDRFYPKLLKEITNPPAVLYVKTDLDIEKLFSAFSLAVVGTRKPTRYGFEITRKLTRDLVKKGVTIVSGLARGVDYVAHTTTLAAGGVTIAVFGTGLDVVYPADHKDLAERIVERGAIVSEFPPGTGPTRMNFPIRNRIIAGLSRGVLVTQAAARSGTLITAGFAADFGRDVFAVPGNITSEYSPGTNGLLQKGAKLVSGVEDILEEYPRVLY